MKRLLCGFAALLFAACSAGSSAEPTVEPASPSLSASPRPSELLPNAFPIDGPLTRGDNAARVVAELDRVTEHAPILKLNVSDTDATLIALGPENRVLSYRWYDGVVDSTITDFAFLGQKTFRPADFPLTQLPLMLDIADMLGVKGRVVYQVQQFRDLEVVQSVSSQPETKTVFFNEDATAVEQLGTTDPTDVERGLSTVIGTATHLLEVGFSAQRGYWAVYDRGRETVLRQRMGGLPAYIVPTQRPAGRAFLASQIDVQVITGLLPEGSCEVVVRAAEKAQPRITVGCDGSQRHYSLAGEEIHGS